MTERLKRSRAGELPFQPVLIGLSFSDRQKLYARIEQRVDQMMERGLLEEAGRVLQDLGITASGAIGYKEFLPYFQGTASLEEAVEQLKRDTRRYAKRQLPGLSGMPGSIGFCGPGGGLRRYSPKFTCIFEKARYDRKIEGPLTHRLFCCRDKLKKGGLSPTAFSVNLFCVFG